MNWQRFTQAAALFCLLSAIYFFTYTGEPLSDDEVLVFDAAHSILNGRGTELGYTHILRPFLMRPNFDPVVSLDVEPLQAYVSTPLVWLGQHIPGIGVMQTTWLLNIFFTALTAVVLFYYGIALGYRDRVALVTALLFGLATYAWVYSKLYFREPLFTLLILFTAYAFECWRQRVDQRKVGLVWLASAGLGFIGALLAKEATLLIVPALLVISAPTSFRRLLNLRVVMTVLAVVMSVAFAINIVAQQVTSLGRYNFLGRLRYIDWEFLPAAFPAYVLSPGFSVWTFSPVLLIGLAGFALLLREKRFRQAVMPLLIFLAFTIGYSVLQQQNWYGGLGWGPRYLLPIVPFMTLWLLPVIDRFLSRRLRPAIHASVVGLIAYSVFVQVLAAFTSPGQFTDYLYREASALQRVIVSWQAGVWNPIYNPILALSQASNAASPVAWILNNSGMQVIPVVLLACVVAIGVLTRRTIGFRRMIVSCGAIATSLTIMFFVGLRTYYQDPRYIGTDPVLFNVLDKLNEGIHPGDAVLLNNSFYVKFFMNYYKGSEPIYVLPNAPGEAPNATASPDIVTDNPEYRANSYNALMLPRIALDTSRWWFLTELTPFSPGKLRPTEHYLVRHYFPVQEVFTMPSARLILFSSISAPPDTTPPWPAYKTNVNFGPARLVGFDLPYGETAKAGNIVPISLLWKPGEWTESLTPFDYSINVSLVNSAGAVVAQRAVAPQSGFAPMTQWNKNGYYRDNHALELPADLPPGDYALWVLIYNWSDNSRLPLLGDPAVTADHAVIATIHVTQ